MPSGIRRIYKHLGSMQHRYYGSCSNRPIGCSQSARLMQSSNQRSSPISPLAFTSARQAFSLGLLAAHLAFICFSFSIVSFSRVGLASDDAGAVVAWAGAGVVWAEAV